ncbi:MAG: DUF1611 domain-containing protein [Pirellulaceae bacterium]
MPSNPEIVVTNKHNSAFVQLPTHRRIALLTSGYSTPFLAKTAISLLRYRTSDMVGVLEEQATVKTTGELLGAGGNLPVFPNLSDIDDIDSLYIGIAPPGGKIPQEWRSVICNALGRGIDIVSGLHEFLSEDPEYVALAQANDCQLYDVRRNRFKNTATCRNFPKECTRIHSVGHDCSIGKMVSTLEVQRGLSAKGYRAKFLATGQTGIMVSGEGVPIDCVVADFVNGAAEDLVARHEDQEFVLIEGQGSIAHPAFSAVTAGLLHGCAPDGLIFCYEAGRNAVKGFDGIPIVPMDQQLRAFEVMANLRHKCKFIGVAINTRTLTAEAAAAEVERAEREFGLPACDVYRDGADKLVTAAEQLRASIMSAG